MKRVLGILVGASLALAIGCAQSYDFRMDDFIKNEKYKRDLEKHTELPVTKTGLQKANICIRNPKGIKQKTDTFGFVVEDRKFDVTETFIDPASQASLHILARINTPKAATPKKGPNPSEPTEPPPPARGDFITDVIDVIKSAYNTDLAASQLKPSDNPAQGTHKSVPYKSTTFEAGDKDVKVYFYGDKNGPGQVALIFEGPKGTLTKMSSQINYSLNSLVVGPKAPNAYSGQDELAGDEGPGVVPM
jgi:hypothetical protein